MTTEVGAATGKAVHYTAGFFITCVVLSLPDGRQLVSHSRLHRKGLPPVQVGTDGIAYGHRLWLVPGYICGRLIAWPGGLPSCSSLAPLASLWVVMHRAGRNILRRCLRTAGSSTLFSLQDHCFLPGLHGCSYWKPLTATWRISIQLAGTRHQNWRWFAWKPRNAGYSASLSLANSYSCSRYLWIVAEFCGWRLVLAANFSGYVPIVRLMSAGMVVIMQKRARFSFKVLRIPEEYTVKVFSTC
jgi:hypothetical protein